METGAYEQAPDVDDFQLGRHFFVVYVPTDTVSNTREHKDVFWVDLKSAVIQVPSSDYLFVFKMLTLELVYEWERRRIESFNDWGGRDMKIMSPVWSSKQPLPGVGPHDSLHGR